MKGFSLRMARKKIISKTKAKKLLEMIDNLEAVSYTHLAKAVLYSSSSRASYQYR